jgi:hypothetical protein
MKNSTTSVALVMAIPMATTVLNRPKSCPAAQTVR